MFQIGSILFTRESCLHILPSPAWPSLLCCKTLQAKYSSWGLAKAFGDQNHVPVRHSLRHISQIISLAAHTIELHIIFIIVFAHSTFFVKLYAPHYEGCFSIHTPTFGTFWFKRADCGKSKWTCWSSICCWPAVSTLAIVTRNCKWQVARAEHLHRPKRRDAQAHDKSFISIIFWFFDLWMYLAGSSKLVPLAAPACGSRLPTWLVCH